MATKICPSLSGFDLELPRLPVFSNIYKDCRDTIILDTPPIGLVTDARTLMHFADTSIYVLRADYSKKGFLRSIEKLSKEDIPGLGILLNDVKMSRNGYGYGYSYGYGYYEEEKK